MSASSSSCIGSKYSEACSCSNKKKLIIPDKVDLNLVVVGAVKSLVVKSSIAADFSNWSL